VTAADVAAVTRLQVASWREAYAGIIPSGYLAAMSAAEREQRHLARVQDPEPRAAYLLAERDGSILGMTNVGPARDEDLDPAAVGEIRAMYVDPPAWSTGVGAALMHAALEHLLRHGAGAVTLWVLEGNARARAFYERWGFRPDGSRQVVELGQPVPEVRYYRQLPAARSPGPDF
ncbi:MAG TPA: GNAT family N-acetyltransferase, partial [Mycobacteriales bacterium]|nr:GNAT family N-acetyltransferase [Mycobacteriales bacterium]